ncbi:MATE family efflux transporter [Enterocloster bolteae]|uniref:MATE family efflux transporter n=1 Tax=Enterocloster bolteae TaxID=208479 RepID=UPI0028DB8C5A|nr:MATE family efflux transporter [Enterocloster bolteae]
MFSNKDLKKLIAPLFLEQLLTILVGLADTFVISFVGEAAVSGVSLVNSFNTIFIFLFTALASGGAVIVSQYIGSGDKRKAGDAASQLLMISTVFSAGLVLLLLLFGKPILGWIFGRVEEDVMTACVTYLRISAYSYPALAVYNAGAALCRSIGKTSTTMYIAVISNIVNVVGNVVGVVCPSCGCGRCGVAVLSRKDVFGGCRNSSLLSDRKRCVLHQTGNLQLECRASETYPSGCASKRRGAGNFPVCQGGS